MSKHPASEHAQRFLSHLQRLDREALAKLRHSLAFDPGTYSPAFPYVERFVSKEAHERDARRLALYAVAGLFARHPRTGTQGFASAFAELFRHRKSESLEKRFVALLAADAENIHDYLRQAVSLLAADEIPMNHATLLDDLALWMNPWADPDRLDRLRQRWARDFYRVIDTSTES
ncbi:CRISPR system Cascade subunit CasB [Halopseudomonas formosensis]|jgi:CRISPR system Cascade subunit CasB|uniref:CRISPR system Cascade subunit CasB n=1 Tax=Halopseudomonas formosensis TaxID=1002526 RepID=A0A1I6BQ49_9GAMM|nr:type I-E CRISPR-associated protein Cse2/CasB [Halopseudomonas formosensis]SFQ83060.1 CRISPR system Cascade subunit CasB [Halopseudomonas formosensis]